MGNARIWLNVWGLVIAAVIAGCDGTAGSPAAQRNGNGVESQGGAAEGAPVAPAGQVAALGLPPVMLEPPVLDMGTLPPNQETRASVHIRNLSDKPLKVLATKADCTCTAVDLSNRVIEPGQSVPLEALYRSSGSMGQKKAAVRVIIEGYDTFEVPVRALVAMAVRSDPMYFDAQVKAGTGKQTLSGEYTVFSADEKPFRILAVNGGPVPFADGTSSGAEPRNRYRLKWDLSGYDATTCLNAQGERMPGWIVVETDHPGAPIFDIEIRHECVRRQPLQRTDTWILTEKRILAGLMQEGQSTEFEVFVKLIPQRSGQDPPRALIPESPQQFTAELVSVAPAKDGWNCRIRITPAAGHRGLIYGTLRLHSSAQSAPLTVIGTVR